MPLRAFFLAASLVIAVTGLPGMAGAQTDVYLRLDRLENQLRQMTGLVEQLSHRNQQLESQLKRMADDNEYRFQELGAKGGGRPQPGRPSPQPGPGQPPMQSAPSPVPAAPGALPRRSDVFEPLPAGPERRADVFDPEDDPDAPGSPRLLGSIPGPSGRLNEDAPGGRNGAPMDLSALSGQIANSPPPGPMPPTGPLGPPLAGGPATAPSPQAAPGTPLPAPPRTNPNATGAPGSQIALAPTGLPRDEYDLAYGQILRKEYAQAEEQLRAFLRKYPQERLAPDANYWLGESLYQRQRYQDAAKVFLGVSKNYEKSGKAPEAMLRLGQSLAALGENDAACETLAEVTKKHPRVTPALRQTIEREQKRVQC